MKVPPLSGHDLLKNNSFEGGKYIPWTTSFTAPGNGTAAVKDGQFCVTVTNKGVNAWDAQGAARPGFKVFWCNRSGNPHEYGLETSATTIGSLAELEAAIA